MKANIRQMDNISINLINGKVIDAKRTSKRVNQFLKRGLEKYLLLSGMNRFDLKSVKLSDIPSHANAINHNENMMQNILHAESVMKAFILALNSLDNSDRKPYKKIIKDIYINNLSNGIEQNRVGYAKTQYYKFKGHALVQFAVKFQYYQLINNVEPTIDLCEYSEQEVA